MIFDDLIVSFLVTYWPSSPYITRTRIPQRFPRHSLRNATVSTVPIRTHAIPPRRFQRFPYLNQNQIGWTRWTWDFSKGWVENLFIRMVDLCRERGWIGDLQEWIWRVWWGAWGDLRKNLEETSDLTWIFCSLMKNSECLMAAKWIIDLLIRFWVSGTFHEFFKRFLIYRDIFQ